MSIAMLSKCGDVAGKPQDAQSQFQGLESTSEVVLGKCLNLKKSLRNSYVNSQFNILIKSSEGECLQGSRANLVVMVEHLRP